MKKLISIKTFSLLAITILSMNLISCRQDDENDIIIEKNTIINKEVTSRPQKETTSDGIKPDLQEADPPVKNGTHWRTKN
ncbi:hypothetical protein [Chryseobacterium polytrichastri]|uniref:Uncharacterized protein n=1 Tax=Chryseobacterium polytrichastri TaxID=1302687 RepID=A0A1M6W9X7_9FLAO|nr:hypothetical protein [Chryseobacterium polytrichastri]SHK90563.1 hypothetical protein SAMN05444267_100939 [Chryseobacterium polytrichastri]